MNPAKKSFTLRLLFLTFVLEILVFLMDGYLFTGYRVTGVYWIVLFFALSTWIFHALLMLKTVGRSRNFTTRFLGASGIKIVVFMIAAGIYVLANRSEAVQFLLSFFLLYLVYTVFEIREILAQLKIQQLKG